MTHTTFKYLLAIICSLAFTTSRAQSLTIVNNTYCKLEYKLYGSVGTPCGDECSITETIAARKTVKRNAPAAIDWKCNTDVVFWRAFSLNYEGADKIGNCRDALPFSGVRQVHGCPADVEYSWNVEDNGDITVVITPVIFPKKKPTFTLRPETIQGGVKLVIVPMMDIAHFIEVSNDGKWLSPEGFRIRTNQRFLVNVHAADRRIREDVASVIVDEEDLYNGDNVCTYLPLEGSQQLAALNCYCGTDQKFKVRLKNENLKLPLVYTATQP